MSKKNTTLHHLIIPSLIVSIIAGVLSWSYYQISSATQPIHDQTVVRGRLYPQAQATQLNSSMAESLPTPPVTTPVAQVTSEPVPTVETAPPAPVAPVSVPSAIDVKLIIQQPNKKSQWSFQVVENSTVDAAMRWASGQYKFSYVTKQFSGLGTFVDEINGVKSNSSAGMYWLYYVNGTPAATGVSGYILHDGDTITWKYQKS